ncbi:MAG TPA: His/Gly/Thr/Pro-type tRNA ligase C-terminal domain-containing protein, partial [Candidatus Limnocylindrales bacterium]|nr:His/Gly/Thr/Pro-type tRNA ligase C-terminal domain-containing protein [Candidatus Limnocylindrales bacterium]
YSEKMGATYLDAEGHERPIEMGCYGIGISRLVAAAIEQNHDDNGIIWPFSIAPFHVLLLPINYNEQKLRDAAEQLYHELQKQQVEVLLDDRDERAGVKFKDADLIGIPLRATIGAKGLEKGIVELRRRRDGKTDEIPLADAVQQIKSIINQSLQA